MDKYGKYFKGIEEDKKLIKYYQNANFFECIQTSPVCGGMKACVDKKHRKSNPDCSACFKDAMEAIEGANHNL